MQPEASRQNYALKDYKTVLVNEKTSAPSHGLIPAAAAAAAAELSLQITSTSKANRTFNHVCVKSPSGRGFLFPSSCHGFDTTNSPGGSTLILCTLKKTTLPL